MTDAPPDGQKRILLIVDDEPQLLRMMARLLSRNFDAVHTAGTEVVAAEILASHRVTHLIVDYDLGCGTPCGEYLIGVWRPKYPSIERALIITGAELPPGPPSSYIDKVITKGEDPILLLAALEE